MNDRLGALAMIYDIEESLDNAVDRHNDTGDNECWYHRLHRFGQGVQGFVLYGFLLIPSSKLKVRHSKPYSLIDFSPWTFVIVSFLLPCLIPRLLLSAAHSLSKILKLKALQHS